MGREDIGWCHGGCDCHFAVEAISYLFLFPVLLYIGCFFFFFSNLLFVLINVVGLNNHLIPWPGPQDYNYPVVRWFFGMEELHPVPMPSLPLTRIVGMIRTYLNNGKKIILFIYSSLIKIY